MKKQINKVVSYIKENKLFLLVMLAGIILFAIQMHQVVFYADDFSLGIVSKDGIKAIGPYFVNNYLNWGGGLTVVWATFFLLFRIEVWKVFQIAIIAIMVWLVSNIVARKDKKEKALIAGIIWLGIFAISIWVSREVLYWLDGGLAYAFTTFQTFIYFYYLYSRLFMNIKKKYDNVFLPIVAFLAGWGSAQTAIIAVITPIILFLWKKFHDKEKIHFKYYIFAFVGLIGACIYYCSPGNMSRMGIGFDEFSNYSFFEKILYRVDGVYGTIFDFITYPFLSTPFFMFLLLMFNSIVGIKLFHNHGNKKLRITVILLSLIQIGYTLCALVAKTDSSFGSISRNILFTFYSILASKQEGTFRLLELIPYCVASVVMLSLVLETFFISKKNQDPFLFVTVLSGLLMQGVMVMAPYGPLRTTCYIIFYSIFAIAYLFNILVKEKMNIAIPMIIVIGLYDISLLPFWIISYLLLSGVLKNINKIDQLYKYEIAVVILILGLISGKNYMQMVVGYAKNKTAYNENIQRIEAFKEDENNKELTLLVPIDETYGFTPMAGIEWVENDIKKYFDIDVNVKINKENY